MTRGKTLAALAVPAPKPAARPSTRPQGAGSNRAEIDFEAMEEDELIRLIAQASSALFTKRLWKMRRRSATPAEMES